MRRYAFFFLLFVLFPLLSAQSFAESPRDCVVRAGQAIDSADATLFTDNVYLDALVANGLDDFFADIERPEVARDLPPLLALLVSRMHDPGQKQVLRKLLANELTAYILDGVASGAFAGRRKVAPKGSMLAPLFANASTGRKELIQIGEGETHKEGTLVPCTLLDYGNGMEYPLDLLVQDVDGRLMVTEVHNLRELFARLREEAKQFTE
ncbi:MAG: hypothetical protein IJU76_14525 [Desulfovibrionaceae bacterium]|nr:hypothetical protein [Desulfovibrionaceae bacterium]